MQIFIIAAGVVTALLGVIAFSITKDATMLQGGLTLGGGWIICGLFSYLKDSKWHGIVGGGVLGLLGAGNCLPAVFKLTGSSGDHQVVFRSIAAGIAVIVTVVIGRGLLAEKIRRQIEALKAGD